MKIELTKFDKESVKEITENLNKVTRHVITNRDFNADYTLSVLNAIEEAKEVLESFSEAMEKSGKN